MTPQPVSEIKMVFRKSIMDWLLENISKPPKQRKPLDIHNVVLTALYNRQGVTGSPKEHMESVAHKITGEYLRVKSALAAGRYRPMSEDESIEFLERQIKKAEADG